MWERGRSRVDGIAIVNKVLMGSLTEKTYEQRLEGVERVSSHVIIQGMSPKRWEKEHVQMLRTWDGKDVSASGQKHRGMFKRGTPR